MEPKEYSRYIGKKIALSVPLSEAILYNNGIILSTIAHSDTGWLFCIKHTSKGYQVRWSDLRDYRSINEAKQDSLDGHTFDKVYKIDATIYNLQDGSGEIFYELKSLKKVLKNL